MIGIQFFSKTDFDKRLRRLQKRNLREFMDFVNHEDDDVENDLEITDEDDESTISAYTNYMIEVMSAFVFSTKPTADLDVMLPKIKESAKKIIKITKFLIEVNKLNLNATERKQMFLDVSSPQLADEAENITTKDAAYAIEELINLSVDNFQNATDQIIAPTTLPIWCQYLTIIFKDIQPKINLNDYLILTSRADMYYLQHIMQYILDTPKIDLELYIWWTIVEEIILHTTSDIRKLHNEYVKSITNLEGTTPRSLYCTSGVNQMLGMAVSYAIAQPNFSISIKPQVQTMIENIRKAFDNLVSEINWMDTGTKCSTLEKSHAMKSFVGFPEWILDDSQLDTFYADLDLNVSTHLKNLIDALKWQMFEKLKTLNLTEEIGWATTPTNVNAFHTFQANAISEYTRPK